MRTRRAFDYQPPSYDEARKLSEKRGGLFDAIIKRDGPRFLKPKVGDNFIRILPPTWENANHYALEVKIHRNIGADKASYLCLRENEHSPEKDCPICEERQELARQKAPQKDLDELRAGANMLVYLIDRSNESQGPQLWGMSHRSDSEIIAQSLEKRQQRYLPIAHPIDGFDIEFTREGEGLNTRYRGFKVARTSSPLTDDPDKLEEWLNYIDDNPIPDMLNFYSADHIRDVFAGKAKTEEEAPTRLRDEVRVASRPPEVQTVREAPRQEPTRAEPNGHNREEDPPFDVETRETRRAPPAAERPSPRETSAEPPTERRRATLDTPSEEQRSSLADLRNRLAIRTNKEGV